MVYLLIAIAWSQNLAFHDLGIDVYVEKDRIRVEAFYGDDSTPVGARVLVEDAQGKTIAEGKTDAKGNWHFKRPSPGKITIRIDDGNGHKTKTTLEIKAKETP